MSKTIRIIGLGLFAVIGAALAVLVAANAASDPSLAATRDDSPAAAQPAAPAPAVKAVVKRTPEVEQVEETPEARPQRPVRLARLPQWTTDQVASAPQPPQPRGVMASQPPPFQQQLPLEGNEGELLKKLVQLGNELANQQPKAGGPELPRPSDAEPIAAPAASATSPSDNSGSTRQPKSQIKRSKAEGDSNLSIHIQDTDLREVLDMLAEQGGLNILASNSVQGRVSASLNEVDLDTALAAILKSTGFIARREGRFIFVGAAADFLAMEQSVDKIGTRVYRPNYVKATELQALVAPLLTPALGTVSITSPSQVGIASDQTQAGGNSYAGSEAVLVRDYEAVLCQVDQVFEEIDRRPLQVAIEAMILSVKMDDKNSLGVSFQLLRDKSNIRLATGAPLTDLAQVDFKDGGLKFGFLDSSLGAFINALETIGDTNVIATPRLMCLNKQRAEILIGEKLGYLSTTQTETSTTQSVEFLEVGTQLRIRPFISNDGLIRMEVHPELSTGSVNVEGAFTLPNKVVTEVTTNIMVRDGCTMVIGGLMREDIGKTAQQIPLLGSAPVIGFLFRSKTETISKNELIVLITPHIVYDHQAGVEGQNAAGEFHRRQAVYADNMSPIGTRYLGRKYLRLAQDAWARNDRNRALQFANLAINFDPINRAAIDLRGDIISGNHNGDHSGGMGIPPQAVVPWASDESPNGVPVQPWDGGQMGSVRPIEKPGRMR